MFRKPLVPVPRLALCAHCLINAVPSLNDILLLTSRIPPSFFPPCQILQTILPPKHDPTISAFVSPVPSVPVCCTSYAHAPRSSRPYIGQSRPEALAGICTSLRKRRPIHCHRSAAAAQPSRIGAQSHCTAAPRVIARGVHSFIPLLASASPPHPQQPGA